MKTARTLAPFPALVAVAGLALHCGGSTAPSQPPSAACTAIGCEDGLHIRLVPDARWPAGSYKFVIVAEGSRTVCEGAIPLKPCDQSPSLSCDGRAVMITESGCALPAAEHGFSDIHLASGPEAATVSIERDGVEIVREDIAPTYKITQPNGPGCPPTCRQASGEIRVP